VVDGGAFLAAVAPGAVLEEVAALAESTLRTGSVGAGERRGAVRDGRAFRARVGVPGLAEISAGAAGVTLRVAAGRAPRDDGAHASIDRRARVTRAVLGVEAVVAGGAHGVQVVATGLLDAVRDRRAGRALAGVVQEVAGSAEAALRVARARTRDGPGAMRDVGAQRARARVAREIVAAGALGALVHGIALEAGPTADRCGSERGNGGEEGEGEQEVQEYAHGAASSISPAGSVQHIVLRSRRIVSSGA